jgi:hypothetical protein
MRGAWRVQALFGALQAHIHLCLQGVTAQVVAGTAASLGPGGNRYCWVWIVGRPELLSETGAESAIIDGATNLKQQIGALVHEYTVGCKPDGWQG